MVAVKVASLQLQSISVTTLLLSRVVFTFNPIGVLKLSGETASATACAVFLSLYSSVIVACKLFTLQLPTHQLISQLQKSVKFL